MRITLPFLLLPGLPRLSGVTFLCGILLLSACTTVPVNKQGAQAPGKLEVQNTRFQQGKAFYLNKQYAQAASVLLPLAQQGHVEAQYTVGYMYHYGHGLPRNEKESTRWIATAAARGNARAQEALRLINAAHDQRNPPPTP